MSTPKNILVYAEVDDRNCQQQVVDLAQSAGSSITVCEVVPSQPRSGDSRGVVERVHELRWALAFQRLRQICDRFAEHMDIDYGVFSGEPFIAITEQVHEQGFDLVVHISPEADRSPFAGLNATGMHLMRKCPSAVWAMRAPTETNSNDVVVAVDRERGVRAERADGFARFILETALAHARARSGKLHLVHAWQPFGTELLDHPSLALSDEEREFYCSQQRVESEDWFRGLLRDALGADVSEIILLDTTPEPGDFTAPNGVEVYPHLCLDDPVRAVTGVLEATGSGLLVMGNVGSSAHPGVLIGPTTESLLAQCRVPTLALKPSDYVSPLFMSPYKAPGGASVNEIERL